MNPLTNTQDGQSSLDQEVLLNRITNRIRQSLDLQEILSATVAEVRSFLGTDRVMVYRFYADGSGEVMAESIQDYRLPSLLGLNFPADDIPPQAREMFIKARQRVIVDVASRQIAFSSLDCPDTGESLAAEEIYFRTVDSCHAEYLTAMGVQSSFVLPIVHHNPTAQPVEPQLWGLLVSHHSEPRVISQQELRVVQQVADQVSIAITQSTLLSQARAQAHREATINRVSSFLHSLPTLQLQEALEETVAALQGSGGRLYITAEIMSQVAALYSCGAQPKLPDQGKGHLIENNSVWQEYFRPDAATYNNRSLYATTNLYKEAQLRVLAIAFQPTEIRGILVVPLQYRQQLLGYLSVFRDEVNTEIVWAGRVDPDQRQLQPRNSFEAWRELKRGQAKEWTREEMELAQALGNQFSTAIQIQEQTAELRQSLELASVLKEVTDQIRRTLDIKKILRTIVQEVRALLHTDRVMIYQLREGTHSQVIVEAVNGDWSSVLGITAPGDCFLEEYVPLYQTGRVGAINNVSEANLTPCHLEFLQSMQVQANLIVPIRMDSQVWGLLIAHECQSPRVWQAAEIDLLQQLADQAAIAIHQAELYQQSRTAAKTATAQAAQLEQTLYELEQTQTQLIQTEKMSSLGQLVAGVAHEINNPVSFIYGNLTPLHNYVQDLLDLLTLYQQHYPHPNPEICQKAEAIDLEFVTEDLPKMLTSMKTGADRICQIVLSLRNFSRLDQAKMKPVDVHEGIDSTLFILQHRLKAKPDHPDITVIKEYGNLPLVECYAGQLNQVFMNILSNAIDALEYHNHQQLSQGLQAGPNQITIRTATLHKEREAVEHVVIRIADNGPGIPEAVRSQIFDPFFTTKPVGKGTGLGLSISYRIIQQHHGVLKCDSQPDQGTEFSIEIPIRQQL